MRFRAVLFDFDYTLGDATDAILAGYRESFAQLGLPAPDREAVRRTIGYPISIGLTMLTGIDDPARRADFVERFRRVANPLQISTAKLCPGAKDLLVDLHRRGIACGVVSSKPIPTLGPVLERLEVRDCLSLVIGGDTVKQPKPDPEGLNSAVGQLALPRTDILYCGDTVLDAEAAHRAGLSFCAVLNGTTGADAFSVWDHVHIAPDLFDLKAFLA